jgi:DNA-binding LacI/PurR family transcriptional regulator
MNIAFVCFSTSIPTVPSIIEGCDTLLYKQGFSLLLFQSQCDFSKEEQILLSLEEKPVDALIIEPVFSGEGKSNIALLQKLAAHDIPVVLVNNYFLDTHFTTIKTDEQYVGTSIVDYLYSKGHRKIGILYEDDYYPSILRAHSTIMRMQQYGLQVPNEWIIRFQSRPVGSPCCQAVSRYFEITSEHPTCFICSTDRAAITFLEQAEERNIQVPKDISLIGYGNTEAARIPGRGLTTVDYPGFFVGKSAANQVLDSLLAPETSEISTQSIFPKLIERDSVIEVKPEKPTLPEDALHL